MKKLLLSLTALLSGAITIHSQTLFVPNGTNGIGISGSDNIGIGTTNPPYKLSVFGSHYDTRIHLHSSGAGDESRKADLFLWASEPGWTWSGVGIGNNVINDYGINRMNLARGGSYIRLLENEISFSIINQSGSTINAAGINSDGSLRISGAIYSIQDGYAQTYLRSWGLSSEGHIYLEPSASKDLYLTDSWSATGMLNIKFGKTVIETGNVLIGKTSQTNSAYKLDFAGKIRADEITVNTTGADFVFQPSYKLRSLSELETYIKSYQRLPDIVPASQMQEEGVSVSEMQTKLLQKVEELILYILQQDKKIEALKKEIIELKKYN